MDSFFQFARGLVASLAFVLCVFLVASDAHACSGMTQDQAMAACQQALADQHASDPSVVKCQVDGNTVHLYIFGNVAGGWQFDPTCTPPPPVPCASAAPISGTIYVPDGSPPPSGVKGGCTYYLSNGDCASNGTGQSACKGTWTATGSSAATGVSDTNGFGTDASGNPSAQPKLCGANSCMDPNTGNICASTGSGSVCVAGPPGWTGGASTSPYAGSCASGGGGSVCAGSPPPSPVGAPGSPISDPATQIKGSDQYQVGAVTGTSPSSQNTTNGMLTVNTYGTPGSNMSSGKTTGDNGPAPSSSTAGDGGSASGGSDCNSPPVCSGDAVNCGILREQWYSMCSAKAGTDQIHKDLAGDGTQQPPTGGTHTGSDVTGSTIDTGDTSGLNSTGLGWGTSCPFNDLTVSIGETTASISFQPVCDYGPYMRGFVLLLAAITSAGILGGFRAAPFGASGGD